MSEGRTERETLLEARVRELEASARASIVSVAQGGVFEGIWRTINKIVPPWLAIAALVAFLGYHGYGYYMAAQITAAETQLKNAKAAVEDAEAAAQNQTVNDVPMRLAMAKAQLANTVAEASRAKADANAKTAQVNDETLSLATAKAQLANTLAEASRAKAEAAAKTAQVNGESVSLATAKAQLANTLAEASGVKAEADAKTALVNGESLSLATAKAQLANTLAEASRAKAEAAAKTAQVNGETMSLARAKAELATMQNQAALAHAKADAASKQSGLQTLTQREVLLKLVITQMKAAESRIRAGIANAMNTGADIHAVLVPAACDGNEFANYLGCPAQYVRPAAAPQPHVTPGEVAAVETPPPGPAMARPSPTYRKPATFDCSRASMGTDFVICASDELLDAEARLEDAYKAAHTAGGDSVRSEQREWMKRYGPDCGLPFRGRPAPGLIGGARKCVLDAMTKRIGELQGEQ